MRWEILSTQIHDQPAKKPRWIEIILLRLFAFTLRLYPAAFRADFADDMLRVFAMTLRESPNTFTLLWIALREWLDLPTSILGAWQQVSTHASAITVWRARQVTRWSSLTFSLLILHSLISPLVAPQTFSVDGVRLGLFYVLLFLTAVSMLLAWRWQRLGGLLTIVCGIMLGSFLAFYIAYFYPVEVSWLGLALIGIGWALPFATFGFMFYQLSQLPAQSLRLAK